MATDTISSSSQTKAVFDVSDNGWIKIDRAITSHWMWEEKPFDKARAWIDLILLANHKNEKIPYKGEVITCKRGDVCRSILFLSDRWGWSRNKTKRFLNSLESDGMVFVNATTNRTTITIVNYGKYQDKRSTNGATRGQRVDSERTTSEPHTRMIKNDKECKEDITLSPNVHDGVVSFDF